MPFAVQWVVSKPAEIGIKSISPSHAPQPPSRAVGTVDVGLVGPIVHQKIKRLKQNLFHEMTFYDQTKNQVLVSGTKTEVQFRYQS